MAWKHTGTEVVHYSGRPIKMRIVAPPIGRSMPIMKPWNQASCMLALAFIMHLPLHQTMAVPVRWNVEHKYVMWWHTSVLECGVCGVFESGVRWRWQCVIVYFKYFTLFCVCCLKRSIHCFVQPFVSFDLLKFIFCSNMIVKKSLGSSMWHF